MKRIKNTGTFFRRHFCGVFLIQKTAFIYRRFLFAIVYVHSAVSF